MELGYFNYLILFHIFILIYSFFLFILSLLFILILLHDNKFIFSRTYSNLLCMFKSLSPGYIWITIMPMISMIMEMFTCHIISQLAISDWLSLLAKINTGLIQSNRIKGCKHSNIRKDWCIIFTVAVTVRRYICYKANMESRSSSNNRCSVFCHLAPKQ